MKRSWMMTLAVLAAMSMGLSAQDLQFGALPVPSAAVPQASGPAPVNAAAPAPAAQREWLVLVFMNGVNNLGIWGCLTNNLNQMEAVGSTDKVAILAEYGLLSAGDAQSLQFQQGAKTVYIKRDADTNRVTSPVVYTSNFSDMGNADNLVLFAKRALRLYPAKKLAVIVWNHGAGRLGISFDDVSKNYMRVDDLGRAMGQIAQAAGHKVDLFATDACLMQMASVAYELRNSVNVIVGSEETVPGDGYPYTPILASLTADPGMGPEQLGSVMVDDYLANYNTDATLSALRTAALPAFVRALDNWIDALKADPKAFAAAADPALGSSVSHFGYEDSKDLVDYIDRVDASPAAGSQVKAAGAALKNFIENALLIRYGARPAADDTYTAANGLAIYMPDLRYDSSNYESLSFSGDSEWGDFLLALMQKRLN